MDSGKRLRTRDLDQDTVARAYSGWAPVYDVLCGPVLATGRRAAATHASRVGGRILEIGVGTGLSFPHYAPSTEVIGIDLSEPMLARARQRLARQRYPHVKGVFLMDAHHLAFDDASFDCVVAPFVITLVNCPEQVLSECARVVKPGGEIVLVSHLQSEGRAAARIEQWFAEKTAKLGLRPDFPFDRLTDWAASHNDIDHVERAAVRPFGIYSLVRMRRSATEGRSR